MNFNKKKDGTNHSKEANIYNLSHMFMLQQQYTEFSLLQLLHKR